MNRKFEKAIEKVKIANKQLIAARNGLNWTQREVADKLDVPTITVGRWERGETMPRFFHRRQLCRLFEKSEEELGLFPTICEKAGDAEESLESENVPAAAILDPAIPARSTVPLIGRENVLLEIKQHLHIEKNTTLVALNGLPGVGKTALAITLTHDEEIRGHYQDGILWAGLGVQPNIIGHLSRWGSLLGIKTEEMIQLNDQESWAKAIHKQIGERALLLVLDDVWQLKDILTLKVGGPRCGYLVTTRFPSIAAEVAVEGLISLVELSQQESMQLLDLLAPQVVPCERDKVENLVSAVGGLPLALTLIGNYLRKQIYGGSARRMSKALEKLSNVEERMHLCELHSPIDTHPSLPGETSHSLQLIVAVSDQFLHAEARSALYALSVFPSKPDTFSEETALAVANCSYTELDALIDTGLLECSGDNRYRLHQVVADYARLRLSDMQVYERFINCGVSFIETHQNNFLLLEREQSMILAALDMAYRWGRPAELIQGIAALTPFLIARGMYTTAQTYAEHAYDAARQLKEPLKIVEMLALRGKIAIKQGLNEQAKIYWQSALSIIPKQHTPCWQALQCEILCELWKATGKES